MPTAEKEAEIQDMNRLALSILACGYLCRVYSDTKRPAFMPLWNYAFNQGGPDPDYVYLTAEIDPAGTYLVSGFRGTSRFVDITQQEWDMLSPTIMATGGAVVAHDHRHEGDARREGLGRDAARMTLLGHEPHP